MNKFKLLFLALWSAVFLPLVAQNAPQLPIDKAVRYGRLPNGLTYYIRHNAEPQKQVNFYIAQKVGSVQEEEEQRGLAHFLEHMAFNGSKHFPHDGQLVRYCESIGVKFGDNLNAYTSTDETVYNIDNVPVTPSNIDSCLYILADWSGGLFLTDKEIDKERGVIQEEWRMTHKAIQRIYERQLPNLYPGSRYGHRLPIGLMEVVRNFDPEVLRAYYKKWYRPDLQGIIIVGDINVDEVEQKVKNIFSSITMPPNPAKYEYYPVPNNNEPIYIVDKDKEQVTAMVTMHFKHEPIPTELRGTPVFYAFNDIVRVISSCINARLAEMTQKADCPFVAAEVRDGNYLISKTAAAFTLHVLPKPGQDKNAVRVAMEELERAAQHGLTMGEIKRVKAEFKSAFEKIYGNKDKQKHNFYTQQYVRHFLEGNAIPDIETEYELLQQLDLPQETYNEILREYTAKIDTNFVVFGVYPDKEGVSVPTVDDLREAITAARSAKLDAYVDNVKNEPLIARLPRKGKIIKQTPTDFGYTMWTLSNGARVFFKQTDFHQTQILMTASSKGGSMAFAEKDIANSKLVDAVMAATGLGNFTFTELNKALSGKQISIGSSIGEYRETLSGSATPRDLRTLFELIYLKFQKPANDTAAYQSVVHSLQTRLKNADKDPMTAFRDSITATLFKKHPRRMPLSLADLEQADYETIKRLYTERYSTSGDFDFFFTGAFDVDSLRYFTERYIASLPKVKKREDYPKTIIAQQTGIQSNAFFREMEAPQAVLMQIWHGKKTYDLYEDFVAMAFGEILSKRFLKNIREDRGLAYTVEASAALNYGVQDTYGLQIVCPFTPEQADSVLLLMKQEIDHIAQQGVTESELEDFRKFEFKELNEKQRSNSFWQSIISSKVLWGKDLFTHRAAAIEQISSEQIRNFVNYYLLKDQNRSTIIMLPEVEITESKFTTTGFE